MKQMNYVWIGVGVLIVVALGALAFSVRGWIPQRSQGDAELIGGARDAHGCLIAAGYSWNESAGKCMRAWSGEIQAISPDSISEAEARTIAEKSCIKGGEALGNGIYNENSRTWWFDANLNSVKDGCNPACVVSAETRTAEINWRCTGLIEPPCACPEGYRKEGEACNPECYSSNPPCLAPSIRCSPPNDSGSASGESREYISRNQTQCAATDWVCSEGTRQFYDESGCGCETTGSDTPIPVEPDGGIGTTPCTEDAKICPDGTSVGRDPNNNCEFMECGDEKPIPVEPDGGIGLTDPYTRYVSSDPEECKTVLFMCIEGAMPFNDATGCGCRAIEPKKYVSRDVDECSRIRYMCVNNRVPFSDEDGCGCEFTFGEETSPGGKLKAVECTPEQRKADICTAEYAPVCGWSDPAKIQCIRYPCAQTYGNICSACKEENVAYYTIGKCPTEGDELK